MERGIRQCENNHGNAGNAATGARGNPRSRWRIAIDECHIDTVKKQYHAGEASQKDIPVHAALAMLKTSAKPVRNRQSATSIMPAMRVA